MEVKICGLTTAEDVRFAVECGADCIGLILAASPRRVTVAAARELVGVAGAERAVLLFRNAPVDEVVVALAETRARWVQFHGSEPVSVLAAVAAAQPGVRLIRAWEVSANEGVAETDAGLRAYLDEARSANVAIEVVIVDVQKGGVHPGYPLLAEVARRVAVRPPRVWCAGGLTPENVSAVAKLGGFDGVDVASGVEAAPGRKDAARVAAFVRAARGR
ncbi:MAG: phosphoribosylanthranilate isomerase [Phycisphaerales bacterium]|nr:phosphoribosylanthranilate isomerase [Phycisphaerales bacterium]